MTVVDTVTGELVEFDRAAAERRAERIILRLDTIADNYAAVMPMIREAIEKRDDIALGYRSPGDYVSDRFGGALQRLGVDVRRAVVGELTAAGLSTRAIAPVVGVSHTTVERDLDATGTHVPVDGPTVSSEEIGYAELAKGRPTVRPIVRTTTGLDGRERTTVSSGRLRQTQRDDAEVVLNSIGSLLDQARRHADKLTPAQIARVKPKADLWTVGLGESLETLTRLLTSLTEEK
jgi:hypothetical protein